MLFANHPHFVGYATEPPQSFDLYADELEMLSDFAEKTDKKEMRDILQRLAQYSRAKAERNKGPVHFNFK